MDMEKYTKSVPMLCPTCGCSDYEIEEGVDQTIEIMKCASCGRTLSKDELIRENSENINAHLQETAAEAQKEIIKKFKDDLRKTFKNNKYITIK